MYCSVDDVLHEFTPDLKASMLRDYGSDFEENISRHIEKAQAFVDASLARAYSVPLHKASAVVVSAECKIAAYFAAIAYSEKDEVVQDKYETAVAMLDYLVQADDPALVDEELDGDTAGIFYGSDNRVFMSEELSKW